MKAELIVDFLYFGTGKNRTKAVYGDIIEVEERASIYACRYKGRFKGQEKILHHSEIKLK
jgi:hypothetical protein